MIEAVVFDLDGVLLDSEQVWDEVREALAHERGGRWSERAQADMMGMSSPEWSRYMHETVGLPESPEELNGIVVEVPRPFLGAHTHHVRLRAVVPAGAPLADEPLAHLVPDLLGVEQQAVEVEDDGLDHRPW